MGNFCDGGFLYFYDMSAKGKSTGGANKRGATSFSLFCAASLTRYSLIGNAKDTYMQRVIVLIYVLSLCLRHANNGTPLRAPDLEKGPTNTSNGYASWRRVHAWPSNVKISFLSSPNFS